MAIARLDARTEFKNLEARAPGGTPGGGLRAYSLANYDASPPRERKDREEGHG
jgi:hypothetical protein